MKLTSHDKLLFIGDSITDCGRTQPAGEGLFGALGTGYVALVDALINARYPELVIRTVNKGTGGHTVRELAGRWKADVEDQNPDWLSVCIGINDVWRQFDTPAQPDWSVPPDEYGRTLGELVAKSRPHVKGLLLLTPFYIEPNKADAMRARMDEYGAIVKDTAARHDCIFVDTQAAFDTVLEHVYPATLAWDRVHSQPDRSHGAGPRRSPCFRLRVVRHP